MAPAAAVRLAAERLARLDGNKADPAHVAVVLRPLAYADTPEAAAVLLKALPSKHRLVRWAAARSLIYRGRPEGKHVVLHEIAFEGKTDLFYVGVPSVVVPLIVKSDLPVLLRLWEKHRAQGLFDVSEDGEEEAPPAPSSRPAAKKGGGLFDDSEDLFSEEGGLFADAEGYVPLWVLAALTKLQPEKWTSVYETQVAGYMEPTDLRRKRRKERDWLIEGDVTDMLGAVRMHCTPRMAKRLAETVEQQGDYGQPRIICAIAYARIPQGGAVLGKLAARPAPLRVKMALVDAARHIRIVGMKEKLDLWSRSRNVHLARAARKCLAETAEGQ